MKQPFKILQNEQSGFGKPGITIFLLLIMSVVAAAYCFIQANSKYDRNRMIMDVTSEFKQVASQLVIDNVISINGGRLQNKSAGYQLLETLTQSSKMSDASPVPDLLNPELEAIIKSWTRFVGILGVRQQGQQEPIFSLTQNQLGTLQSLNTSLISWFKKIQVNDAHVKLVETIAFELSALKEIASLDITKRSDDIHRSMTASWNTLNVNLEKLTSVSDADAKVLIGEMKVEVDRLDPLFKIKSLEDIELTNPDLTNVLSKNAELQLSLNNLQAGMKILKHEQHYLFRLGVVAALFSLIFVFILAIVFWRNSQAEIRLSKQSNSTNQRAILRLLDEITHLANGDLTTRATVTEDITGAIADSVNFAIETITDLVETISKASEQVNGAVAQTGGIAKKLSRASNLQNREVRRSSNYITAMANVMKQLSLKANKARDVSDQALMRATAGQAAVGETIESTQQIRNLIQDTSKRLKRLGESSQQIGEIIRLVNDIAERTNLLALNASIQASASGGQNRISTVSDEVQTLSEQVDQATRDIGALIDTIQADTRAAIHSMETSTEGVVKVSSLAERAGVELGEIPLVSEKLSEKIQSIAERSSRQAEVISKLSGNMKVISDIAKQTNAGMAVTIKSISSLQSISQGLTDVVGKFTIPDTDTDTNVDGQTKLSKEG